MASFFASLPLFGNGIDDLIEKATSENLPIGTDDWVTTLDIADKIKAKVVSGASATTSLRKRLNHPNPNVQILTLKLIDACVKNSGEHFLVEVASREFVDNLVSIARSISGTNSEVRQKALSLIQNWGLAFKGKPGLYYMTEVYERLQADGQVFPPVDSSVSSAMVDTVTAPAWIDSEVCMRCRTPFTAFNRKHHCRNCGQTVCNDCSSKKMPLPKLGIAESVRVCDPCHTKLTFGSLPAGGSFVLPRDSSLPSNAPNGLNREEEDLAKAIAASLESSKLSSPAPPKAAQTPRRSVHFEQDEDEELKRAIEASLKDSAPKSTAYPSSVYPSQEKSSYIAPSHQPAYQPSHQTPSHQTPYQTHAPTVTVNTTVDPNDLTAMERDNLRLFCEYMERVETDPNAFNPVQVQSLLSQLTVVQSKLVQILEETAAKYKGLYDLNEGINTAVKVYDEYLKKKLSVNPPSQTYSQPGYSNYPPQSQTQPQAPYQAPYPQASVGQSAYQQQVLPGQAPYQQQVLPGQAPYQQQVSGQAPYQQQVIGQQQVPGQVPYQQQIPGQAPYQQQIPGQAPYQLPAGQAPYQQQQLPQVQEAPLIDL